MHLGIGSSASRDAQQQDAKEARRVFRESIRSDWYYPALPAYQESGKDPRATVTGGFKIHEDVTQDLQDQVVPETTNWEERYYGSSDSDVEGGNTAAHPSGIDETTQYKFDGPDSVGEEISDRIMARRRKRQMLLAEEMNWNDGLEHYIRRRDLWTGAKTTSQVQLLRESKTAVSHAAEVYNSSSPSSPRSSSSVVTTTTIASRPSTATTSPDPIAMSKSTPVLPDMLVPVMSRLLTNHPVRKKIGSSMYTEIYSKIIVQSRTPAVPINLVSIIRSLVQGWKADGEWPPKISAAEPSMARKKAHGLKESVKAVTRVLKMTSGESVTEKEKPG